MTRAAPTEFWLIRHAPVHGPEGVIHASDAPVRLTARRRIAALRQTLPTDAVAYCSPARRTVRTAEALRLQAMVLPALREQDFGAWTGRTHAELASSSDMAYASFWNAPATSAPPGGESFVEQIERTEAALASITAERVVLVVHSGTVRAALALALALPAERALSFVVEPLSLTRLDRLETGWRVGFVNEAAQTWPPRSAQS